MPEEEAADLVGGRLHVKDDARRTPAPRWRCVVNSSTMVVEKFWFLRYWKLVVFADVDHAPQILDQAPVRVIGCRLVEEAPAVRVGVQDDLHGVNDRRLAAARMSGEKVDFLVQATAPFCLCNASYSDRSSIIF